MKILKILGIIVLVIVLFGVGVILLGPSSVHLERQITIYAPAEPVYAEVSNMKAFNKWSPWFALDENARYEWEGPMVGEGAKLIWYSDNPDVGNGSMEIVETADMMVRYEMIFDQDQDGDLSNNQDTPAYASMILGEADKGTLVTWTFDADNMTGFGKLFALMMESFLGPFYERGLASLKERVENRPNFTVKITTMEVDPIPYLGIQVTSSNDEEAISQAMEEAYGEVMTVITQENLAMAEGYPLAVATDYSESSITMICGIPVGAGTTTQSDVAKVQTTPDGMVVRALHFGDYGLLEDTHNQIDQYVTYYGYEYAGAPWEIYVTDPGMESDTSKWITEVYYPIAE